MSKKKSIYIVGTNGLGVNYGGWDKLVSKLIEALNDKYNIYVYTSKYEDLSNINNEFGATPIIVPLKANGFQSIFYDFFSMLHASFNKADIVLVLGLSGGVFFPIFKLFKSKIILNPDGAEWKRTKWNFFIKKFLKLSEYFGIKFTDIVVADNKIIQEDIKKNYSLESYIAEYGGDHVEFVDISKATLNKYNIEKYNYAFKVCRIVPENNLDSILSAFSATDKKFILIGNWSNSEYGIELKDNYSKYKNLILLDPIYDQSILDELRGNCRLYIHGHSVGGTNPSLVEAMNLGLCCVVYKVNYNIETTNNLALYFEGREELLEIINNHWNNVKKISDIENSMLKVANERYIWNRIIKEYDRIFSSIK
jgi:hypothetical protein